MGSFLFRVGGRGDFQEWSVADCDRGPGADFQQSLQDRSTASGNYARRSRPQALAPCVTHPPRPFVLPAVHADMLRTVIEPVVENNIVLVTNGHRAYPPNAKALGLRHEPLNQ